MSHSAGEPPTSEVESSGVEDEKKIGLETVHGQSENEPSSDSHNHNNEGVKEVDDMESKDTNGNINSTQTTQAVLEDEGKVLPTEQADYSSFTKWEKRFIVFFATIGAFFSPFTAQIYFPALTEIAKDLHVSNSKINLTMTTYMVPQPHTYEILEHADTCFRFSKRRLQLSSADSLIMLGADPRM